MQSTLSPKSQKLLQLRDRLQKLNGHEVQQTNIQKLQEIDKKNKKISTQISQILDIISEYCYRNEQKIKKISKEMIQKIKQIQIKLIQEVEELKQKQLDLIKQDIDQCIKSNKIINKLFGNRSSLKNYDQYLIDIISQLQPQQISSIKQKILNYQTQIQVLNLKISSFQNKNLKIFGNQVNNTFIHNKNIKSDLFLKEKRKSLSQQQSKPTKDEQNIILIQPTKQQLVQKQKKKMKIKFQNKKLDEQKSKIQQKKQFKILKNTKYNQFDQQDQIDQNISKNNMFGSTNKIIKKKSQPAHTSNQQKTNIEQLLQELKKNRIDKTLPKTQKHIKFPQPNQLHPQNTFQSSSKIKSEKSIKVQKYKNTPCSMKISRQNYTIKNQSNVATSGLSISLNSGLRQSKSKKNSNWLDILKEQQIKYNSIKNM